MKYLNLWILTGFVILGSMLCRGQAGDMGSLPPPLPGLDEVHPIQEAIVPFLIPLVMSNVHELKTMVCSDEYQKLREKWGDRYAVDVAFRWAEQLCWNNRAVSLFVMFLAMMDHRNVCLKLPLLGPILWLPLSGEFPDEFLERLRMLPAHLFPDSPPTVGGDRDKMQHFFGSAFLAYLFDISSAQRLGDFVEWGEDAFVVGGTYDIRDLEANARGRRFAEQLRNDRLALPSSEMNLPLAAGSGSGETGK
jgi:hypothetical protein